MKLRRPQWFATYAWVVVPMHPNVATWLCSAMEGGRVECGKDVRWLKLNVELGLVRKATYGMTCLPSPLAKLPWQELNFSTRAGTKI
jgi:hypothetical protein